MFVVNLVLMKYCMIKIQGSKEKSLCIKGEIF